MKTKALFLGILSSFFFAFTFIFNRLINLSGGFWLWSPALRYFFTLPLVLFLVIREGKLKRILSEIKRGPLTWLLWSTVGFGLFYLPLTMASQYGESWFTAATWQLTIVMGVVMTPLFGKKIPVKNLICSIIILLGIALLQAGQIKSGGKGSLNALILIIIGAAAYPLGNRKMMAAAPEDMTTTERVFGMTLCSMPFWIISAIIAGAVSGPPTGGQCLQSLIVALFSGVIATLLFFEATKLVKNDAPALALVEASQCGEVIFTLLGGILFLSDSLPSPVGFVGILIIVGGMTANSLVK